MISQKRGKNILKRVEITHISNFGIWLLAGGIEYFLPYVQFPWFRNARISEVQNIKLIHGHHLSWPDLDVDLDLDSIKKIEQYPLIYR